MPKEQIRKRGKRKPKTEQQDATPAAVAQPEPVAEAPAAQPEAIGGIHPSRLAILKRTGGASQQAVTTQTEEQTAELDHRPEEEQPEEGAANWTRVYDPEFPFGVLDPDVKAYFRNLEDQIKDWEGAGAAGEEREDRQLFLSSVLQELRGHELQVATDPEVSVVLERLLPSLNDWGRRVIGDSFGEKWEALIAHRFGSHIVQTWMTLAASTLDREARGIYPPQQKKQEKNPEEGVLPTMAELITSLTTTLIPVYPSLLTNSHASPPLRLLLLVLTPNRALPSLDANEGDGGLVRSKRSGKFRKNQSVQGKSILGDEEQKPTDRQVPESVAALRKQVRNEVMQRVSPVEWHGMGVNKVGSAAVQLLLEAEAEDGESEKEGSLLDIITEGLASNPKDREQKPYLSSLLVSPTGTRLFEAVLSVSPKAVYKALWKTYFRKKLGKLASHPYANFVVAKGVSRLSADGLKEAIAEVQAVGGGKALIKTARTSVLVAFAERATALGKDGDEVMGLVRTATELPEGSDALVPALMALKTVPVYEAIKNGEDVPDDADDADREKDEDAEAAFEAAQRRSAWENRRNAKPRGALDPNMQGCLLLQALVDMPGSTPVLESLYAQPVETLLQYAYSPIASRLLDRVLLSSNVPPKYKRKLPMAFVGHYLELASDRLGSRVADTIWATADGYLREKIARSLIPSATQLAADAYGRFLAKKLELHLLQRRPDEWREKQLGLKHHFAHQKEARQSAEETQSGQQQAEEEREEPRKEKKKRKGDEIDEVFGKLEKKKTKTK